MPSSGKFLVLLAGDGRYALPLEQVSEIIEPQAASPVPRAPAWCAGVIFAQVGVVAVMDLAKYMGDEQQHSLEKLIVLDCRGAGLALQAERLEGIVSLDQAELVKNADGEYLLLLDEKVPVLDAAMLIDEASAAMSV